MLDLFAMVEPLDRNPQISLLVRFVLQVAIARLVEQLKRNVPLVGLVFSKELLISVPVLNVQQVTIAKVLVEAPPPNNNAQLDISVLRVLLTMQLQLNYLQSVLILLLVNLNL